MVQLMKGLHPRDWKAHPSLVPLFVITGIAVTGAFGYLMRLALFNPDVSWDKKKNPEPHQRYANKQYKFYSTFDYKDLPPTKRPDF